MTDLETRRASYVPVGRPVRRFVIAQIVLAMLFGALWWSGLVAPRLSLVQRSGSYDKVSGHASVDLEVRTRSFVGVEVRGVALGAGRATVASVRIDGRDIATASRQLSGGGKATMVLEFTCRPTPGSGQDPTRPPVYTPVPIEITVTTPIGLNRTRSAGTATVSAACVG